MATPGIPKPANPYNKTSASAKRAQIISIIAIIITIGAITAALLLWQQTDTRSGGELSQIKTLSQELAQTKIKAQADFQVLNTQLRLQQQTLNEFEITLTKVRQHTQSVKRQQALSQTAYLLQLANLHLSIGRDVASTQKLLQMANKQVQNMEDAALFPLKHALAHDLAQLKNVPRVNITDIVLKLDAISELIQKMPILPHQKLPTKPEQLTAPDKSKPWYEKWWYKLGGLKGLITIRHIQKPIMPLLAPNQQLYLRENIQSKIAQAQWAVMHKMPALYKASLLIVQEWISMYFHDQEATAKILAELKQLAAIDISPKLPDISDSLRAIQRSMQWNEMNKTTNKPNTTPKPRAKQPIAPKAKSESEK